jgi:hypothetical protein
MKPTFYLYGSYKEGRETLPDASFSFVVDDFTKVVVPSFLIWQYRETDGQALLCKIRRTTRPADIGMRIDVYDAVPIRLVTHGLLNSLTPQDVKDTLGMTGRELANDMILMRTLLSVPDEQAQLVKNVILKSNPGTIDESYFVFEQGGASTELVVEGMDAFYTAFKMFGIPSHEIPNLQEQQILDFDIGTLFADARKQGITADGKHFFEHAGRRLYLHKVDRTPIERCLGVDLIYNYIDQQRLVFVQYKCQRANGKYYHASDASHNSELGRMEAIPGLATCANLTASDAEGVRLCRCPVFVKLCKREVPDAHAFPVGVYYPLCVWKWLLPRNSGLSVRNEPQFNNAQFRELVKTGLIGSTPQQSLDIQNHLIEKANDDRLKLIFAETSSLGTAGVGIED